MFECSKFKTAGMRAPGVLVIKLFDYLKLFRI